MSSDDYAPLPEIDAADVEPAAYLLDVREDDEWEAGHVEGSLHMPMRDVMGRLDEIPTDRRVVVACRVGGRSARATAYLLQTGREAVNLGGGLAAWAAAGRPLVDSAGGPGQVI